MKVETLLRILQHGRPLTTQDLDEMRAFVTECGQEILREMWCDLSRKLNLESGGSRSDVESKMLGMLDALVATGTPAQLSALSDALEARISKIWTRLPSEARG